MDNGRKIVIGCIACGIIVLTAILVFPKENPGYVYSCTTGGARYAAVLDRYISTFDAGDKLTLLYALARIDPEKFTVADGRGELPADIIIEYAGAKYTFAGRARNIIFNIAILAILLPYPVYLLRRFAVWAGAVLKRR